MKTVTAQQMREIDKSTIEKIGIPGIVLMENAASAIYDQIIRSTGYADGKKIMIAAGKGNNGGDAFAVARYLYFNKANVKVYILASKDSVTGDAAINLKVLENTGINVVEVLNDKDLSEIETASKEADIIIDGLLGTGFKGELKGIYKNVIDIINSSGKTVISIDIPSGLNADTGEVSSACIRAWMTVTLGLPKIGMLVHPGCDYTGRLVVRDIGIPPKVIEEMRISTNVADEQYAMPLIPKRKAQSNKGNYGRVLIITGSNGMTGAGCLCASAALRTGAGLVYLGVPASLSEIYENKVTESITISLEDKDTGYIQKGAIPQVMELIDKMDVIIAGPGLSVNNDTLELVRHLIRESTKPLILDADALNLISKDMPVLNELKCDAVVTPHPGEMSRLTGMSIEDIQRNRVETAREFAVKWKVVTVLKGSRTVTAFPDGTIYINPTGNAGMATAGSGDVLSGIIGALAGQGLNLQDAAAVGVYLHGLAGDKAADEKGMHGLIAGDIVNSLPFAIKQLCK